MNSIMLKTAVVGGIIGFASPALAVFSLDSSSLKHGKRTFTRQDTCTEENWNDFGRDYSLGMGYVDRVSGLVSKDNPVWQKYFGESYHDDATVKEYQDNFLYGYIPLGSDDYEVKISCGSSNLPACTETPPNAPAGAVAYAVTTDNHNIHLCDEYFNLPDPENGNAETWCGETDRVLAEFETASFVLLHEVGHLDFKLDEPLVDNAWCDGNTCIDLATNDEDAALENADNWAYAALNLYWNDRCERDIPTVL